MVISIKSKIQEISGVFDLPSSKSISNRLLVIKALSNRDFKIQNLSRSDDTSLMMKLLERILLSGSSNTPIILDTKNAGTVMRFLCAYLAILPGNWILTGSSRIKKRPVEPLVRALHELNADITYLEKANFLPLAINGKPLQGGKVHVSSDLSSQFITALLLIGSFLKNGIEICTDGKPSSQPYIDMTISLMLQFRAEIRKDGQKIFVNSKELKPFDVLVEPDWSAASYWFELVALSANGNIILKGLHRQSLQGDLIVTEVFDKLGVHSEFITDGLQLKKKECQIQEFEFDFTSYPDLAPAVIVTCAGLGIKSDFTGLKNLVYKESDRLKGIINIIEKLGMVVEIIDESSIRMVPDEKAGKLEELTIHAAGDHRMALCSAPLSLIIEKIHVVDGDSVSKSYPGFWEQMKEAGLKIYNK